MSLHFSSCWQPENHPEIPHLVSHCERIMKALCISKCVEALHQYIKAIPYKVMTGAHEEIVVRCSWSAGFCKATH